MKRSNFTFLFLFALLSFVSSNLDAQATSSSCIDEINISVDAQCGFVINDAVLGATGPAMMAQALIINGVALDVTGSGTGFSATGSLTAPAGSGVTSLGLPDGGTVQYQLFQNADGSGPMLCWGNINFEIKQTPDPVFQRWDVMCGERPPSFPTVGMVAAMSNGACSAPIDNFAETTSVSGDACSGFTTIRNITGQVDIDGGKSTILLRSDTLVETPLDTSMVVCPNGMDFNMPVTIPCEFVADNGGYPTADLVFDFWFEAYRDAGLIVEAARGLAIQQAYPYVDKGTGMVVDSMEVIDTIIVDTVPTPTMVEVNGETIWVVLDVIEKDTSFVTVFETTEFPVAIPLPKTNENFPGGTVCNLTVTCSDTPFPGCAGPESKILRNWTVLDWCNGSVKECMQWIVQAPQDPEITDLLGEDADDVVAVAVPIAPWVCSGSLALSGEGDCGCVDCGDVTFSASAGVIGADNVLRGLWVGETAVVTATLLSECGSSGGIATRTFTVTAVNTLSPVPVAEDQVNVSLTFDPTGTQTPDGGTAKVFVDAIDAGSHNSNCGEVTTCLLLKEEFENPIPFFLGADGSVNTTGGIQLYRAAQCQHDGFIPGAPESKINPGRDPIYFVYCKESVKFCCSDIGDNQVSLVVDNGNRIAVSHSTVTVEDKSQSFFVCSDDDVLECGEAFDPMDYAPDFGQAICTASDLDFIITGEADACGNGADVITWTLDGEVICQTIISFNAVSQFNPYEIKWPKHYTGEVEPGVQRECEIWRDSDGDPFTDSNGNPLSRIVEYATGIPMGASFDCSVDGDLDTPSWCTAECSLIQSNFETLDLEATDACRKIIRQWTVVDWCTFTANGDDVDDENDTSTDSFQAVDDEWLDEFDPSRAGTWYTDWRARLAGSPTNFDAFGRTAVGSEVTSLPCGTCDKPNKAASAVYFRYTSVDRDGFYTFDQVINVIDEDAPIIDAPPTFTVSVTDGAAAKDDDFDDCVGSEAITATVSDACGDDELGTDNISWWVQVFVSNADGDRGALAAQRTFFGSEATMSTQTGTPGTHHLIVWSARDGCGNIGEFETLVYFADDKAPTPICIQDLSTAIMTNGEVVIWAADYDNGSFDNCSEVTSYFLLDDDGNPTDDLENGTFSPNLVVTCELLSEQGFGETLVLGLYVVDALGNVDFCNITLNVNGAQEQCDFNATAAAIAGRTATLDGDMIESAEVILNVGARDLTSLEGTYMFTGNALSRSYDITAEKNDDFINGVTVLDLVLIQKHVLGLESLTQPELIIAADIDNNGIISASDLSHLRRLILGLDSEFSANSSWRFVDASHDFDAAGAVFPFPEVLSIENLTFDMLNENFIGIKIGDVSGNAIANSGFASTRSANDRLALQATDASLIEGELVEVAVTSQSFTDITGYQFTMELSGIEFVGATSGAIEVSEANFAALSSSTITTAWAGIEGISSDETLFTMTFRATANVALSGALNIGSSVAAAKAYTSTQEELDVVLEYNTVGTTGFALLQNTPNPFNQTTQIGFELPVAGQATLTIFDVTGKTVSVMTETYNAGYNEITLRKSDLGTTGVLYYQLESGDNTATKKMVIIE